MKTTRLLIGALAAAAFFAGCASPSGSGSGGSNGGGGGSSGHDGSPTSPKVLSLDTPFTGKIGAVSNDADSASYYVFNTGSLTQVLLSVDNSSPAHTEEASYSLWVYSDAALTNEVGDGVYSLSDYTAPYLTALSENTNYYAVLLNLAANPGTFSITAQTTPSLRHNGSLAQPQLLFLDTSPTTTMVVTNLSGDNISYFAFSAPSTGTATISYPSNILNGTIYSDSAFSTGFAGEADFTSHSFTASVTSGQSYYLKIEHDGSSATRIMGPLTITVAAN